MDTLRASIGSVYQKLRNTEQARRYFEEAKQIAEEIGDQESLASALTSLSDLIMMKEKETSINYAERAVQIFDNEYTIVRQMMDNGASGYLIKNAMSSEVLEGIKTVNAGKTFLCHEVDLLLKRPANKAVWLTTRERELLRLITEGYTNNEIADKICLSPETIKGYRKNLLLKLGAKNTALLVKIALDQKLV